MDLISILSGLGALAFIIVPILYFKKKQKEQKRKLLQDFNGLAEEQQLVISDYDFWNRSFAIGIDTRQNKLFYVKKGDAGEQKTLISLSEVEKCSVINSNRNVNDNKIIDRIALAFSFRNARLPEKSIEFYTREDTLTLDEELKLAEKWKALVDFRLQAPAPVGNNVSRKMFS